MIIGNLHRQMVAVDSGQHRQLKLCQPEMDWSVAAELNAVFVAGVEFGDACREYPILFVRAGSDDKGRPLMAPIAALGLAPKQNLFLQGKGWRAAYVPALLRAYPFALTRVGAEQRAVLSIDIGWSGLSQTEGLPLYEADGTPSEHLRTMQQQLEQIELEIQRTRDLGSLLRDKDLLREMRFNAELPDGETLKVDGFYAVEEQQLGKLSDADVLLLQRSGVMGLIYAHLVSIGNLRKLAQWRIEDKAAQANPAPQATDAPS